MVCGTASDVGKSRLVAGLCRLLARRGVRVAPFKAQNMALNSFVTDAGDEIGRSQASQAAAAGVEPEAAMNPILLKPTGADVSQVVVMGRATGHVDFAHYRAQAPELRAVVHEALAGLRRRYDVVVCEGAGGAAEINLLDDDLVNLPLARDAGIPAILVGDIERGGVFAALHGSLDLLPPSLRAPVRGLVINKMRGDASMLAAGIEELERRHGIPTLGIVPYVEGIFLDAEDSLALARPWPPALHADADHDADVRDAPGGLDVAVVGLPHMANFTDLDPLAAEPGVRLRLVTSAALGDPDLVVIPGTKATVSDLGWMERAGIADAVRAAHRRADGPVVMGLCGGFQMLGGSIDDTVESGTGRRAGLGLLDVDTVFEATKVTRRCQGVALGAPLHGYQIHHGRVHRRAGASPWVALDDGAVTEDEGCRAPDGRVLGTSLHGLFEDDRFRAALLAEVARLRGRHHRESSVDFAAVRREQFDVVADVLEASLDLAALEAIIAGGVS